ncbi:MAG: hypothetical protein EOO14_24325 [Chitinophagaceae bacterium]|nr:MAG: hypothetical protein EOO14_24325 [Chitinophagaceae bacterium]
MPVVEAPVKKREKKPEPVAVQCYHCGETCDNTIVEDNYVFCCDGCKFVYGLLKENGLCNYYDLSNTPGIKIKGKYNSEKFAFLETAEAKQKLITFSDDKQSQVSFYLPQMHCAS